jgi:hypothetical protein
MLVMFNLVFYAINTAFLEITFIDIQRRKRIQMAMISMLEPDFRKRKLCDLSLPAINFCDPVSMITLLQMRKLVLEMGARFSFRIQAYVLIYSLFIGLFTGLFMLDLIGMIKFDNPMIAMTMIIFWVVFCFYGIKILAPAAYFNSDTDQMVKVLIDLSYLLKTMLENQVFTPEQLDNPLNIPQERVVRYLQKAVADIDDPLLRQAAAKQKLREGYEGVVHCLEFIKSEDSRRPYKLLGKVMTPQILMTAATTMGTILSQTYKLVYHPDSDLL